MTKTLDFKDFPALQLSDNEFECISIDCVRYDEGDNHIYNVALTLFQNMSEGEEESSGITLITPIIGTTLEEIHDKMSLLFMSGLFDDIPVMAHSLVFDSEGEVIEEVNWNDFDDEEERVNSSKELRSTSPTLH